MILLVEDDVIDALTVKRALEDVGANVDLLHLRNGEEALAYLRSEVNRMPFVILLDLNMPRMSGKEFLTAIKREERLRSIPVIVLTTSLSGDDIDSSFRSSVAGYMAKPLDYDAFVEKIQVIEDYWRINRLPGDVLGAGCAGLEFQAGN